MTRRPKARLASRAVLLACALSIPAAALAQASVSLKSSVFVARSVIDAQGKRKNKLFALERVQRGDPLVVVFNYANKGASPAADYVIDNPIPGAIVFTGVEQDWALVSVDNGKTYGALADLKVAKDDGTLRAALPGDVTHVRWRFAQPIPPGTGGRVMFYGTVK